RPTAHSESPAPPRWGAVGLRWSCCAVSWKETIVRWRSYVNDNYRISVIARNISRKCPLLLSREGTGNVRPGRLNRLAESSKRRGAGLENGHDEGDLRAAAGAADDLNFGVAAVEDRHALPHIAHTDAVATGGAGPACLGQDAGRRFGLHADAVVFDLDEQTVVRQDSAAQCDGATADARLEPMLDGVLDERLQQHAGDDDGQRVLGDLFCNAQLLAETHDLDIQVVIGEGKLFFQRHEGIAVLEQHTEDIGQLDDHLARQLRAGTNQRRDR